MLAEFEALHRDLDWDLVRCQRPEDIVFLCGGIIDSGNGRAVSLRHHLLENRTLRTRIKGKLILAEEAKQFFRKTNYQNLISFEEDLALISSVVCVISESAGSLAELGAFSSLEGVRDKLSIIIQSKYEKAESFITLGPIARMDSEFPGSVAFFPWETRKNSEVVKSSIDPHFLNIKNYINDRVQKTPKSFLFKTSKRVQIFYILMWILSIARAIEINKLRDILSAIGYNFTQSELKDKLYCLELVGWVQEHKYAGRGYYICRTELDPIEYRFKSTVSSGDKNSLRRKTVLGAAIKAATNPPKQVLSFAAHLIGGS